MLSCIRDGEVLPPSWIACGRRVFAGDRSTLFSVNRSFRNPTSPSIPSRHRRHSTMKNSLGFMNWVGTGSALP